MVGAASGPGSSVSAGLAGNATAGLSSGLYQSTGVASASETDGETFDGDADFDEYDEWDYHEILNNVYVCSIEMY